MAATDSGGQTEDDSAKAVTIPQSALEELPPELAEELRSGDIAGVQRTVISMQATFGSILPPPAMLREYEALSPGFTRTLMQRWQEQEAHRMGLEQTTIKGNERRADRAQWMGFAIAGGIVLATVGLGLDGMQAAAGALGGVGLASFAGVFISGRHDQRVERREKAALMQQVASGSVAGRGASESAGASRRPRE